MPRTIVAVVGVLVLGGLADARAATWTEARSPHFTVYSDAGERRARNVAWQFEQIRATLEKLWPWATFEFGRPVVVYAARDESSMRGVPKDDPKAIALVEPLCAKGNDAACKLLETLK